MNNRLFVTQSTRSTGCYRRRKGAIALMMALLLTAILGLIACALDIGWIELTRTQLQAVADASSLAGGTELMQGLGYFPDPADKATKEEVAEDATEWAVKFAEYNRNAKLDWSYDSNYLDGDRDVKLGKAVLDPVEREDGSEGCGCYVKTPADENPEYYNYVEVTTLRNQGGSTDGDGPLPLFFGRIFGYNEKSLLAGATAAILPANGFRVNEGSDDTANVMPFAFKGELWDRYERAQEYYDEHPTVLSLPPSQLDDILDEDGQFPTEPLFGALEVQGNKTNFVQLYFDGFTRTDNGDVSSGGDGSLEVNIYPKNLKVGNNTSGNFGTVDFGTSGNSTSELSRQIQEGLNADDLSHFDDNQLVFSEEDPLDVDGDTGISAGIKDALDAAAGECKAIALFTEVAGSGNNASFELVKFVSATVVQVNFSGNPKKLLVQQCRLVDDNAVPEPEKEIGDDTTIFTPLILIR